MTTPATTILVTGATGFLGSHLCRRLAANGDRVIALVHRRAPDKLAGDIETIVGDICYPETFADALAEAEVVFHLAADYRIGPVCRDSMRRTNADGTRAVIDAATQAGVSRIVVASTTAALGETGGGVGDESSRHNGVFRSHYEQTKHIAHGIAEARKRAGAPVSLAILGGIFGPGSASALDAALRDAANGRLPIQVKTTSRFTLCDVDSICDGLIRIAEAADTGAWILAGESVSMPELLDRAASAGGKRAPIAVPRTILAPVARLADWVSRRTGKEIPLSREALAIMDGSAYVHSPAKAKRELGWQPTPLSQSLPRHIAELAMEQT